MIARHKNRPPTPPGEFLRDFLKGQEMTQTELAEKMGVHVQVVNLLVNGRRAITASTALLLAKAFDMTPEFWMAAQDAVELWEAQQRSRKVAR